MLQRNKRILIIVFIILLLICLDQLVKEYVLHNIYNSSRAMINGVLNLTYVENTGGAFGIFNSNTIAVILFNIITIILITLYIVIKIDKMNIRIIIGASLISAGGIGNLLDRIFRGYVIDYIDINPLIKYPMFNIADICVVLGCTIIIIYTIISVSKEK